jgi:HSP20 family molecular chaperone IbpA
MFDYFYMFDKFFDTKNDSTVEGNDFNKPLWFKSIDKEDKKILILDIAGVEEKDLTIDFEENGYTGSIIIKGETETEFGKFSVNYRFKIQSLYVSEQSSYYVKNGLLYIEIVPQKKSKFVLKNKKEIK